MAAAARKSRRPRALARPLVLILLAGLVAWGVPCVVRAHAALAWTRHHALQTPDATGESARGAARWAVRALDEAAPLPWGAEAGRLALETGARQEASNPAAARALYEQLARALDRLAADRWRGWGLGSLRDEARRREQQMAARPDVVK